MQTLKEVFEFDSHDYKKRVRSEHEKFEVKPITWVIAFSLLLIPSIASVFVSNFWINLLISALVIGGYILVGRTIFKCGVYVGLVKSQIIYYNWRYQVIQQHIEDTLQEINELENQP